MFGIMKINKQIIIIASLLIQSGCASFMGTVDFDQDINDLLTERNRQNMGGTGGLSEGLSLDTLSDRNNIRKRRNAIRPKTKNPNASELTAKTAPITISKIKTINAPIDKEINTKKKYLPETYILPDFIVNEPTAKTFGLIEFLEYSVKSSPIYRTEKESLFLSTISLLSERHLWGPRFFDTINSTISGTPEAGDHTQVLTIVNELGVTQNLPNGGSISATALTTFVENLRDATTKNENSQTADLILTAKIPLLRGSGTVAKESLIQAERELIYSVREFERFRREFFCPSSRRLFQPHISTKKNYQQQSPSRKS